MKQKEMNVNQVMQDMQQNPMKYQGMSQKDIHNTIMLNQEMVVDAIYQKEGFTPKEIQKAMKDFGIVEEYEREAAELQKRQMDRQMNGDMN